MKTPEMGNGSPEKNKSDFIIGKAEQYIRQMGFKEAIISIGSDINDDPTIDDIRKRAIVGLVMEYKNKPNVSRDDVDTFINYIQKIFE